MSNMKDRMHSGELYYPNDDSIMEEQLKKMELLYDHNMTRPGEQEKRKQLLKQMFMEIGEDCWIEPPLHSNWGGGHCIFGKNVYANYGLTLVDDTYITVGDYTMFGPNVIVATAGHPLLPELRQKNYQYNAPVSIGRNCWIGAGTIIVPGVTIGDDVVIGAGSIVTKDVPSGVVAFGNPCKVMREINEHDRTYYFKDRQINWEEIEKDGL